MKKIFFISVVLLSVCFFKSNAQLKITSNNIVLLERVSPAISLKVVKIRTREYAGFDGSNFNFLLNDREVLCKVDASLTKATSTEIKEDELEKFVSNEVIPNLLVANRFSNVVQSNNKKKTAVYYSDFKKKHYLNEIKVYDQDGTIIWKTIVIPEVDNENIAISDIAVSNEGTNVYLLAQSQSGKGKKVNNFKLHVFKIDETGITETVSENLEKADYRGSKLKILSNGDVFVGGYRFNSNDNKEMPLESYTYLFDGKNLEVKNKQISDFKNYASKIKAKTKDIYSYKLGFEIKGIYETKEGITMLAEELQIVRYYTNGSFQSIKYNYGNIYVNSFSINGDRKNESILFKNQEMKMGHEFTQNSSPLSFDVLNLTDKLVVIYNDNFNNELINSIKFKQLSGRSLEKMSTICCTIENGEVGTKTRLIDGNTENRIFLRIVKKFDDYALVYVQRKDFNSGSLLLEKISW